jgi:NADH dehydrogenase, FAD-containing subunit
MNRDDKGTPHKVAVIGAGFAGLQFIHALKHPNVAITLVDRRNHHLFQPLLYQVATTVLATSEIAWPVRHLFRDRKDVETLFGEVVGIDRAGRRLLMKEGEPIGYDSLVIATGSRHAYFGNDHWEPFAPGLKRLEDATAIRRRILLSFEKAERETDPALREALLTFAIVGAGPTGVELAGMIAELARHTLPEEFRHIDTRKARILLIEGGPRVLAAFSPSLSDYAKAALVRLGVEVFTDSRVTECSAEGVNIGEHFIACRTIIWAAGVQASPAAKWLGAEADRAGRVIVRSDLTLPDDERIFVLGDTAAVTSEGKPVPGLAPAAKQQGAYAAKVIRRRLDGKAPPPPFRYRHQGNLATIGKHAAIIEHGKLRLRGWPAWWLWGIAHIYFLIGTRSRFAVAWSWLWSYLVGVHSARLITHRKT